jgi:hypothetical protein
MQCSTENCHSEDLNTCVTGDVNTEEATLPEFNTLKQQKYSSMQWNGTSLFVSVSQLLGYVVSTKTTHYSWGGGGRS